MSEREAPPAGTVRLICEDSITQHCRVEVSDGAGAWMPLRGVTDVRFDLCASERGGGLNRISLTVYADSMHVVGQPAVIALQTLVNGADLVVTPPPARRYAGDAV